LSFIDFEPSRNDWITRWKGRAPVSGNTMMSGGFCSSFWRIGSRKRYMFFSLMSKWPRVPNIGLNSPSPWRVRDRSPFM